MMSVGVYDIPKVRFNGTTVAHEHHHRRRLPGRGPARGDAAHRAGARRRRRPSSAWTRPRSGAATSSHPASFPLTTTTGADYDSGEYEKALDAALAASGYDELRAEQAKRRRGRRPDAARHRRVGLRRGHRAGRPARRVRRGRGPRRRLRHRCPSARASTARATTPRSPCSPATSSASRWTRSRWSTPTPPPCRAARAPWARARCRRPAARCTSRRTRCSSGPSRSPPTCSRPAPTTSSPATAASHVAGVPGRTVDVGRAGRRLADAAKLPDGLEAGAAPPRARLRRDRLHVPVRRPRLGGRGRHRDRQGHHAPPHRRRRLRAHPQPAARRGPAARRHRPGRRAGAVRVGPVRRRRQPGHANLADYAIPSAAELPSFETSNTETDSPRNPSGAKGIGESGTIGSTPAIHNAVVDAAVAPRRRPTSTCRAPPTRVERHPSRQLIEPSTAGSDLGL